VGDLATYVPRPGEGSIASRTYASTNGSTAAELPPDSLYVLRLPDGTIVAGADDPSVVADELLLQRNPDANRPAGTLPQPQLSEEPFQALDTGTAATTACSRDDNAWNGYRESDNHAWRINFASFPAYLNHVNGRDSMIASMDAWTYLPSSDCSTVYLNSIHQNYAGGTTSPPEMNGSGCTSYFGDNVNSWGFAYLGVPKPDGSYTLALTCAHTVLIPFHDDELSEADVGFTTLEGTLWGTSVNQCSQIGPKYMIVDSGTHEAGHVFGMGHVAQASLQTMKPMSGGTCNKDQASLGKGDMYGAAGHYPYSS
jgi:hypothetical protein